MYYQPLEDVFRVYRAEMDWNPETYRLSVNMGTAKFQFDKLVRIEEIEDRYGPIYHYEQCNPENPAGCGGWSHVVLWEEHKKPPYYGEIGAWKQGWDAPKKEISPIALLTKNPVKGEVIHGDAVITTNNKLLDNSFPWTYKTLDVGKPWGRHQDTAKTALLEHIGHGYNFVYSRKGLVAFWHKRINSDTGILYTRLAK